MYSLQIETWKNGNKYGDPDETKIIGEYFSENAAKCDISQIQVMLMQAGYDRIKITIVNKGDMHMRSKREQMIECAEAMEEGMIRTGSTRDMWQNDLIWWICKSIKLLLEIEIKRAMKG